MLVQNMLTAQLIEFNSSPASNMTDSEWEHKIL